MKYRFIIFLVLLSVSPAIADEAASLKLEAARFAREAEFLRKQERRAAALEKIEAAAALDPDNRKIRRLQVELLFQYAYRGLVPGNVHYGRNVERRPRIDLETMRRSFRAGCRGRELAETYFPDDFFHIINFREAANVLADSQHPEMKAEVAELNRRVLMSWLEKNYRPAYEKLREGDGKTAFSRYLKAVSVQTVFDFQNPGDLAAVYEEVVGDLLSVFVRPPTRDHSWRLGAFLGCDYGANGLVRFAASRRDAFGNYDDKNIEAALDRIGDRLESSPFTLFRIYGWLTRHKVGLDDDTDVAACRARRDYFEKLLQYLDGLPGGIEPWCRELLYRELGDLVGQCYNPRDPATADLIREGEWKQKDNLPRASLDARILEAAVKRGEPAFGTTSSLIRSMNDLKIKPGSKYYYHHEYVRERLDHYVALISEQIRIAEKADPGTAVRLKADAEDCGVPGIRRDVVAPWKEEIPILDGSHRGLRYRRPVFRGDTLYVYSVFPMPATAPKTRRARKMRLDRVDLKTMRRTEGRHALIYDDADVHTYPIGRSESAFVDDVNAYYGTRGLGIFVFPLDDSEPWTLGPEDGLPSDCVQGLGSIGGKLYAGLGEPGKNSWLIRVDLKTRNWEMLASGSAREGKVPFYNLSPAPRFDWFGEDIERKRLLMFVSSAYAKAPCNGLWAVDGASGEFRLLRKIDCDLYAAQMQPDGNRVLLTGFWNAILVDLEHPERDGAVEFLLGLGSQTKDVHTGREMSATLKDYNAMPGMIYGDYVYGHVCERAAGTNLPWHWGRIRFRGVIEKDRLKFPDAIKDDNWAPREVCLPTPDGRGLLVGDQRYLILLRFE